MSPILEIIEPWHSFSYSPRPNWPRCATGPDRENTRPKVRNSAASTSATALGGSPSATPSACNTSARSSVIPTRPTPRRTYRRARGLNLSQTHLAVPRMRVQPCRPHLRGRTQTPPHRQAQHPASRPARARHDAAVGSRGRRSTAGAGAGRLGLGGKRWAARAGATHAPDTARTARPT